MTIARGAAANGYCPHCYGTGRAGMRAPAARPAIQPPARRMIPFGHDVQKALDHGELTLILAPVLFCGSEPLRDLASGKIVGTRDRWENARAANTRKPGCAMVLPEGESAADFRFPTLPVFDNGVCLDAWTWAGDAEIQQAIGRGLIEAGLDVVRVTDFGNGLNKGAQPTQVFKACATA